MKKKVMTHIVAAAAISSLAVVGMPGEAIADGNVNWKNAATGMCLQVKKLADKTVKTGWCYDVTQWFDARVADPDAYLQQVMSYPSMCLDSNTRGSVYLGPCERDNQNQWWREEKTSTGWKLLNVATGRVLDSNSNGSVYTNWDEGDGNKYQRWH